VGKSTISMAILHSYVKLPEGNIIDHSNIFLGLMLVLLVEEFAGQSENVGYPLVT